MEYYSAIKKNGIMSFVTTWVDDLKGIMLSEISQKTTNTIWFHFYVESRKQMNKQKSEVDSETQRICGCQKKEKGVSEAGEKGLRGTNFLLKNKQVTGIKKYSIGNIVSNAINFHSDIQ